MTILLRDIWPFPMPQNYKVHFARWNGTEQPLDVWTRDTGEWQAWQEYRPGHDDFNRPYIFSLMQFYHEPDIWLFGGISAYWSVTMIDMRSNRPKMVRASWGGSSSDRPIAIARHGCTSRAITRRLRFRKSSRAIFGTSLPRI